MSSLRPMGDRIVVQVDPNEEVSEGGIYVGESKEESPDTGTVIAVGKEAEFIKEGDRVIVSGGEKITVDDEEMTVVRERDVIGVIS